jgi:hypothetical protein
MIPATSIAFCFEIPLLRKAEFKKTSLEICVVCSVVCSNQPVLMEVYRDPDTSNEMLIIFASLLGGVTVAEFSLVGSGPGTSTARITCSWPKIASNIEGVFSKKIAAGMPSCHPKIVVLKNGSASTRNSIDETPKG